MERSTPWVSSGRGILPRSTNWADVDRSTSDCGASFPLLGASDPITDRSSPGRLTAETVAWSPQALTPQMGATLTGIDDAYATVTVPVGDDAVDVTVGIDRTGRLREPTMQRWGDPGGGNFRYHSFGGEVEACQEFSGITIATSGRVWWGRHTEDQVNGMFLRYRITRASHPVVASRRAHTAV